MHVNYTSDGEVKAILKFYLDRPVGMPAYSAHMDFADFETFCSSIISAGVYGDTKQPSWRSISEKELDR